MWLVFSMVSLGLVFLVTGMVQADTPLAESPNPLDLPLVLAGPATLNPFAAANGSNGSAHILVSNYVSCTYFWVGVGNGTVMDELDLSGISATSSTCNARSFSIRALNGEVVIAGVAGSQVLAVLFFAEGSSRDAHRSNVGLPAVPAPDDFSQVTNVAILTNESSPSTPSIVWLRVHGSFSPSEASTEMGVIAVDLATESVGSASTFSDFVNLRPGSYPSPGSGPFWNTWSKLWSNSLSGAAGTDGRPWAFFVGYLDVVPGSYTGPRTSWYAVGPDGILHSLLGLDGYWATYLDAIPAPDGTVAAFVVATNATESIAGWTRGNDSGVAVPFNQTIGRPCMFGFGFRDGPTVGLVTGDIVNGTGSPGTRIDEVVGWPATGNRSTLAVNPAALGAGWLLRGGPGLSFVSAALLAPQNTSFNLSRAVPSNAAFDRVWPSFVSVDGGSVGVRIAGGLGAIGPAPVISFAMAQNEAGWGAGALVTAENGSNVVRIVTWVGNRAPLQLSSPLDVWGSPAAVQAEAYPAGVVVVIRTIFAGVSFLGQAASPSGAEYFMVAINETGARTGTLAVLASTSLPFESPRDNPWWRLAGAGRTTLLFLGDVILELDPSNLTASRVAAVDDFYHQPSYGQPTLINGTNEPLLYRDAAGGGDVINGDPLSHLATDFWTEGGVLFIVAPVLSPDAACSCHHIILRVARIDGPSLSTWWNLTLSSEAISSTRVPAFGAEVVAARAPGGDTAISVLIRRAALWERVWNATFSLGGGGFSGPTLIEDRLQESLGHMPEYLRELSGRLIRVRAIETSSLGPDPGERVTLISATVFGPSANASYSFPAITSRCNSIWISGSASLVCPTWSPISWGTHLAFLVQADGAVRLFVPNTPPPIVRLMTPSDGAVLNASTINFQGTYVADVDGDALVYQLVITDAARNAVLLSNASSPSWTTALADGDYLWTIRVYDGLSMTESVDHFGFSLDSSSPVANVGGPYILQPGSALVLDGSNSSDNYGIVWYRWEMGGLVNQGSSPFLSVGWDQASVLFNGTDHTLIRLTVADRGGLEGSAYGWLLLDRATLVVDLVVLSDRLEEGGTVELAANVTWGNLGFAWSAYPDGTDDIALYWVFSSGELLRGQRVAYASIDSGNISATVTAVTRTGVTARASVSFSISNLPPVATLRGPVSVPEGTEGVAVLLAWDYSPVDNRTLNVSWSSEGPIQIVRGDLTGASFSAVGSGLSRLTVRVSDKDGGVTTATIEFTVTRGASAPLANLGLWGALVAAVAVIAVVSLILVRRRQARGLLSRDSEFTDERRGPKPPP